MTRSYICTRQSSISIQLASASSALRIPVGGIRGCDSTKIYRDSLANFTVFQFDIVKMRTIGILILRTNILADCK